jgi:SAM-dependent methyltransferase
MVSFARLVAAQLRTPTGMAGGLIARVMNRFNRGMHAAVADALAPRAADRLLEIGFGGGTLLEELLRRAPHGRVTGLELSSTMLDRARRRLRGYVDTGRLELHEGTVERLPFPDDSFDGVVSANTIYFWPDPARGLGELRRVLGPGGRLVLGYGTADAMAAMPFTAHGFRLYPVDEVERLLREAGFAGVVTRLHGKGTAAFAVTETGTAGSTSDGMQPAHPTPSLPDTR